MQLHSKTIFRYSRIRPSECNQLNGSNLDELKRRDLKICPRSEATIGTAIYYFLTSIAMPYLSGARKHSFVGHPRPQWSQVRDEELTLPHASSHRGCDSNGSSR
ncbi:hypothetical protein EVAR_76113_1 [Eumeta japonica]|uniref:Uncharacterized protein n=1 Tax=Eumeta variegata TaxID=151549 RepID=A0A4C1W6P7_EUMVA|nr:hypothetical protein EVAR_76113_1 [Eumeta japonica]